MDDSLSLRLADGLRDLRLGRGWSLDQLSAASGVSRATLSRLEKAEVSPTAAVLGKLCAVHELTMSRLLMMVEDGFTAHVPYAGQKEWEDPETGFCRRSVSPPAPPLLGEVLECHIRPDTTISYETPPKPGQEHHLILIDGALTLTIEGIGHDLTAGDCLRYQLRGPSQFQTGPARGARYMLVLI